MNNIEVSALLVKLYADYQNYNGLNADYAEAVARAVAALSQREENK